MARRDTFNSVITLSVIEIGKKTQTYHYCVTVNYEKQIKATKLIKSKFLSFVLLVTFSAINFAVKV